MVTNKNYLQYRRPEFDPWVGKILWRREWLPTPVFLPGEFQEQRSQVGCSPGGHKKLDMTEGPTLLLFHKAEKLLDSGNSFFTRSVSSLLLLR